MTKANNEWYRIEELLFDLHIRFCPLVDTEDNPIKQKDCNAVKDELKQLIKDLISKTLQQQREEIIKEMRKLKLKCTCGCNFGDGCLCKEKREGYQKAISDVLKIIKEKK